MTNPDKNADKEASSIVAYSGSKIVQRDSGNQIQPPMFKRAIVIFLGAGIARNRNK